MQKRNYIYGKVNINLEREYYESNLELKTPKGRIARIDHWFMVMDYYKKYLTKNALNVLEALQAKWTGELMPNLIEHGD